MAGIPTHGLSYEPEYKAWQTMRLRCLNPKNKAYPGYGGRGITVCEQWKDSPEQFYKDMGPKPSPKHELDRKDNDSGYEPGNCWWTTRSRNDRNRRSTQLVEIEGIEYILIDICEQHKIRTDTVRKRLNAGWPVLVALKTPARSKAPNGTYTKKAKEVTI